MCELCDCARVNVAHTDETQATDSLSAGCSRVQVSAEPVALQMTSSSGARPRTVRLDCVYTRAVGRERDHPRAAEMGSGDPEVLPFGLQWRRATVDRESVSEDEVELPVISEFPVLFPCGTQRPMLDPEQGLFTSN